MYILFALLLNHSLAGLFQGTLTMVYTTGWQDCALIVALLDCGQLRNSTRSICTQHKSKLVDTVCICWDNEWSAHFFSSRMFAFGGSVAIKTNLLKLFQNMNKTKMEESQGSRVWKDVKHPHWGRSLLVQLTRLSPDIINAPISTARAARGTCVTKLAIRFTIKDPNVTP